MKYLQHLLLLTGAVVIFFSCQKEYSVENGQGNTGGTAQWQFKDSLSATLKGPVDTAYIDTVGNIKFLTVEGKSEDGRDMITLQVFGTEIKAGNYLTPSSSFDYTRNGSTIYQADITAIGSFTITITAIDSVGISGTFGGKVTDGAGVSRTIKEGKFTGKFKKGAVVNPPPPVTDSGQVTLWSKAGCGGGASTTPIAVSVSTKSGQITTFTAVAPATCGAAGMFNAKLAVGNYTWKAKCGQDSVTGSVSVTKDACTKVEVNFSVPPPPPGDYFPTTANSNWSYLFSGGDTLYVLSTGTTKTYSGTQYSIFRNDYGTFGADTSLYRKEPNKYYEYYPVEKNLLGFVVPQAVEHMFLQDNVAIDTKWETTKTGTIIFDLNGTPTPIQNVTARVRDTLSAKLTSMTVGTTTYSDVLEVHSGYFYSIPAPYNVTQQVFLIKNWYAKGFGLIKYSEVYLVDGTSQTMDLKRSKVN